MDATYIENIMEEQLSREFQWEHCVIADKPAAKLYTTNSVGDEVELVFDYDSIRDALEGFEEYTSYLEEQE